jgi:GntR family transcriptional regulator of vanillate catabolism
MLVGGAGTTMARGDDIIVTLRELIAAGAFAPGQRLAEIPVAARLGVSRTPVRRALALLAGEGLLAPAGARGYLVRSFTFKDILDSIEVRGQLEGMAGRLLAEAGLSDALAARLEACLAEGDQILRSPVHDAQADASWSRMNARFHALIVDACGNKALIEAMARNDKLPFAAAGALLGGDPAEPHLRERHHDILTQAQYQHRAIYETLRAGKGARAESLMREHALLAHRNVTLFQHSIPNMGSASLRPVGSAA